MGDFRRVWPKVRRFPPESSSLLWSWSWSWFCSVLCRLKRPVPRRKYGLLSNYDDSVEMVEGESEEDDTLYEARSLHRSEVIHFLCAFSLQLWLIWGVVDPCFMVAWTRMDLINKNVPPGQISCLASLTFDLVFQLTNMTGVLCVSV